MCRITDLVNIYNIVLNYTNNFNLCNCLPSLPKLKEFRNGHSKFLVGKKYYEEKDALIFYEQKFLRSIDFDVGIYKPYKYLFAISGILELEKELVMSAIALLNDCYVYTDLPIKLSEQSLVISSIYLISIIMGKKKLLNENHWWKRLKIDISHIEYVGHNLMDMLLDIFLINCCKSN